jgi:hypothetical protein
MDDMEPYDVAIIVDETYRDKGIVIGIVYETVRGETFGIDE